MPQSEDDDEEEEEVRRARRRARDTHQRGSELKPSEILALERENVDMSSSSESSDDEEDEDKGDEQPIFEKREKVVYADGEYEDSVSQFLFVLFVYLFCSCDAVLYTSTVWYTEPFLARLAVQWTHRSQHRGHGRSRGRRE